MTLKNPRIAFWTLVALGVVTLYAAFALFATVVHAQPVDPVEITGQAADAWLGIFETKGVLIGGGIAAYAGLAWFLRQNQTRGWLSQGRSLAILSGLGIVGAAFVEWQLRGGAAAGVFTALFAAIGLILRPTVTPAPAPTEAPPA